MTGQLVGYVLDAAGAPVPAASVMVVRAPGAVPDIAAVTDDAGRFVLAGLPPGRYLLRAVTDRGSGAGETDVPAVGRAETVIRLPSPPYRRG
jgi:protocatechuate 3,4-dioxygenase beta subunit